MSVRLTRVVGQHAFAFGQRAVLRAAAAVGHAVGAGGMPGQPVHQAAVVAAVGGPPGLAVGHQVAQVLLERLEVELLDRFAVVEVGAQRIGLGVVRVKDVEGQSLGSPVHGGVGGGGVAAVHHRTLGSALRWLTPCEIETPSTIP